MYVVANILGSSSICEIFPSFPLKVEAFSTASNIIVVSYPAVGSDTVDDTGEGTVARWFSLFPFPKPYAD